MWNLAYVFLMCSLNVKERVVDSWQKQGLVNTLGSESPFYIRVCMYSDK
jgi:hypothetical protein